tara:strand:- start:404 stop:553 length:150 start_codon:yes stop_codon:yes gene_type:complete
MKQIKDIEKCYDLLVEARGIFADLNGDAIVSLSKMSRWCVKTDKLINSK